MRNFAAIARIAAVEVSQATDADRMVIMPSKQRCASCRAHRGGMKATVANAAGGNLVDTGCINFRAVATKVCKSNIVQHHQHDIGAAFGRLGGGWPMLFRWLKVLRRPCGLHKKAPS